MRLLKSERAGRKLTLTPVRSQQRHPKSFLLDFNAWFDYLANVPGSNHAGLMLFSDYGTPKGVCDLTIVEDSS